MKKGDIQLATLRVSSIVAHDIPKRVKESPGDLTLSHAVPELPPKTLAFFTDRTKRTLIKGGQVVEIDPKIPSPTLPPLLSAWLELEDGDLVELSQGAAKHLYTSQPGTASPGILVVAKAMVEDLRAVAVMKLPHEKGLQVTTQTVDGKETLTINVLEDLTLTENTRLFKAGLFWLDDKRLLGMVTDDQTGSTTTIADFFLTQFLSCRRIRKARVVTKAFRDTVAAFISRRVPEDQKLPCFQALNVELASHDAKVGVPEFVKKHFPRDLRDELEKELKTQGVPVSFHKDATDLPKDGRSSIKTKAGITISGASEAMKLVSQQELDGKPVIIIRDAMKRMT